MKYYSTNHQSPVASLEEAVVKGLASDKGLFMPEAVKMLPEEFYDNIEHLSFQEIAYRVADAFFGEDVPADTLKQIVYDTLSFDVPAVKVKDNIYSLELFHGPTLAFKDVGGRFMARLLGYFIKKEGQKQVNVLVATSGDTGSAVANGFLGVEGIHVYVLYPKGKVSEIQEKQFTTLGQNITALEVDGTFDDCQALVKNAFMDADLNAHMKLTSANSINVARFLPQAFYYFYAYAQLKKEGKDPKPEIMVPLVGILYELKQQKEVILATAKEVFAEEGIEVEFEIGTMIETPRAALTANRIASEAEYFSFGTNDLTQMTFGYSRDDIASFLPVYLEKKILTVDPFQVLDQNGVGQLIKMAVEKGRSVRPGIRTGICGEHGGEPSSVKFCAKIGMDYASCSPFRVPIARLAAAQAAIEE